MPGPIRILLGLIPCLLLAPTILAEAFIKDGDVVFVVGDRFAESLGEREVLERMLKTHAPGAEFEIHHFGSSGNEAATLSIPSVSSKHHPDVVVVCVGMVDSFRGDTHISRFQDDLASFIGEWDVDRLVIVSPIPSDTTGDDGNHAVVVGRFADVTRKVANRSGAFHIDLHSPLRCARQRSEGRVTHDGVHLSDEAWKLVEAELAWQLDLSDSDPLLEIDSSTDREFGGSERDLLEITLRESPRVLPDTLKVETRAEPVITPTWEEAVVQVQHPGSIEEARKAMNIMVRTPGREGETLALLEPLTDPSQDDSLRLAALAAMDDLPERHRPPNGIHTVRMSAIPVKMIYDVKRFDVTAGQPVRIILENPDAQPHNLLITKPGALRAIGNAADAMGSSSEAKARHWVPDSPRILHVMPIVDPGDQGELRFIAPEKPGRYPYVCTYPGHWRMMNGVMTVRPVNGE